MSYKLRIRLAAQAEAARIHDWYEARSKGLGGRFADALEECLQSIQRNPTGLQIRKGKYRHDLVSRFPYRVVYTLDGDTVFVYQIRHTSRRPSKPFGP
ncbi:MAG: type II toxin-antitoxin system RelE/ParE family toxin [Flavobacteriales bacterium]|nr:type II toxin-antitoxin system RelE/ParE family toxin [Flavobacteriales bacterium]MBP9080893.1 type II toxin-antitoxin system RelE/ParE family toxin [Flavobacteriales bacterium]